MRLIICSDIHDNIWKLEAALPEMNHGNILLFCGDFCAPFTLTQLANGFEGPVHVVFGNNDGDTYSLARNAQQCGNVTIHEQFGELEIDGLRVAFNHYPEIAQPLAASGRYDLVCYGHDHRLHQQTIGQTVLLNPGEIMGRFGRSTFAALDTETREVSIHDVPAP